MQNWKTNKDAISELGELTKGVTLPFLDRHLSLYDIFSWSLKFTGPSDILMSSFSISEEATRAAIIQKEKGLIISFRAIFDMSTRKNKLSELAFGMSALTIRLNENHSKIMIITGDKMNVAIVGSANFNRIKRFEGGIITSDPKLFTFFSKKLEKIWQDSLPVDFET